jgi:hypothetical protein
VPLNGAIAQRRRQQLLTHERVVHDVIARPEELASPEGQQARISRSGPDEIDDAARHPRKYTDA